MIGLMRLAALFLFSFVTYLNAQDLQLAPLGDFKLESGAIIRDCKIGYRTFGKLAEDKSNAVLFPTWFTGTTKDLAGLIGTNGLVDSTRYYVIAVDAIGDGASSSPSNSKSQARMKFPKFTIRDMVESQHRLVTEVLHLNHLRAVIGISMGGMQTFQWIVSYPDFMDKAIPIVGTPQLSSFDLLLWTAELHAIEADRDWNHGNYKAAPPLRSLADIHNFALSTPVDRVEKTKASEFGEFLAGVEKNGPDRFDANNWYRQLEAMISQDVGAKSGGTLDAAAAKVKAKVLVVYATQDHMVNPTSAIAFAKLLQAPTFELSGSCGHLAPGCESARLYPAIAQFLAQ